MEYKGKNSKVLVIVLIAVIAILAAGGITMGVLLMNNNSSQTQDTAKQQGVVFDSAGYSSNLHTLAVWDSRNLQEAEYVIYNSDAFANPTYYTIGVELASFTEDGSTTFTVKPVLNNPSTPKGVKYSGTMTYAVALTDAE